MKQEDEIVVYLDTSDYIRLCYKNTEQDKDIFDKLMMIASERNVKYYYSYISVFELLQDYRIEFRDDRLMRARFLKSLCNGNQFRFFVDLRLTDDPIGQWYPENYNEMIDIDRFLNGMIKGITNNSSTPIELKRMLMSINARNVAFAKYPHLLTVEGTKFHFSSSFIEKNVFRNYALKRIGRDDANKYLREMILDIELFFLNYFDVAGMKNIFVEAFHKISKMMHGAIEYYNSLAIRSDINSFDVKDYWKRFGSFFPDHADDILNAYFRENFKNVHLQDSDLADICHAIYLPYCDLWRGDLHFSGILKKHCQHYREKIVDNLKLLPERIKNYSVP
jgi:hypothetical protein